MRIKIAALAAVAAVAVAAPAQANEARIEARGGIAWAAGAEEAFLGAAAGYDFDLGESLFAGVEASADKVLVGGADIEVGLAARLGVKTSDAGRLYINGGYSFGDIDGVHLGAGYQHNLSDSLYVKAEYRRLFDGFADINTAGVGLGVRF